MCNSSIISISIGKELKGLGLLSFDSGPLYAKLYIRTIILIGEYT